MRQLILVFLATANCLWGNQTNAEPVEQSALSGFQSFEVITLFPSCAKINQKIAQESLSQAFKKHGKVNASEGESMLKNLLEKGYTSPVCFFSIDKGEEHIEISFEVTAEAAIVGNKYKTSCSIWKDTLYAKLPQDNVQEELVIAQQTQEMVNKFAEDWKAANAATSKELNFQIRTFKHL